MALDSTQAGGYLDFARFASLRADAADDKGQTLGAVAEEFEALFIDLMLKAARYAEISSDLFGSNAMSTYREMFDQQIAKSLARENDFGIRTALERQFGSALANNELANDGAPALPIQIQIAPPASTTPFKSTAADERQQFVNRLTPAAARAGHALGVNPRVLLAQAALETGWGQHLIVSERGRNAHNYFGIKADPSWQGRTVNIPTTEFVDGSVMSVEAGFRAYDSIADGFDDYVDFLNSNSRYAKAIAAGNDETAFVTALSEAGYATDPNYADKILAILGRTDWTVPSQLAAGGLLR